MNTNRNKDDKEESFKQKMDLAFVCMEKAFAISITIAKQVVKNKYDGYNNNRHIPKVKKKGSSLIDLARHQPILTEFSGCFPHARFILFI